MRQRVFTGAPGRSKGAGVVLFGAAALTLAWAPVPAGAAAPALAMSPAPSSQPYPNGATVSLSVGPNSTFRPNSRIEVLECGAPHGVVPTDDTACDGNTVQYGSVLVAGNGSFQVPSYTLYSLPNSALGEAADNRPVCDATSECVLYAGEDQNDFSQPKTFSSPFTVNASATSTPTTVPRHVPATSPGSGSGTGATTPGAAPGPSSGGSGTSAAGGGTSGQSSSASASDGSGSSGGLLAFTGTTVLPWLAAIGAALVVAGSFMRRRLRKGTS